MNSDEVRSEQWSLSDKTGSLREIFDAYCNCTITPSQQGDLDARLRTDPEAMNAFVLYVDLHARLRQWACRTKESLTANELGESGPHFRLRETTANPACISSDEDDMTTGPTPSLLVNSRSRFTFPQSISAVAASSVAGICFALGMMVMVAFYGIGGEWTETESARESESTVLPLARSLQDSDSMRPDQLGSEQQYVVRLIRSWKAKWAEPANGIDDFSKLRVGQILAADSGRIELYFATGARLVLEGPFRFEILGPRQGVMYYGKVVTGVSERSRGFSLVTSVGNVVNYGETVNLGNEFGLNVHRNGAADLVVFDGEVGIECVFDSSGARILQAKPGDPKLRLVAGQGVRIDSNGSRHRIVSIDSERFPRTILENSSPDRRKPVIAGVRDNIRSPSASSFYEIVRGGLCEDAVAYVDRNYEWNGIDASGMPAFLVGADYIKMFNNDKINDSYKLHVELSRPADLYVFWDRVRASPPTWLKESFKDTGFVIGLDEGPTRYSEYLDDQAKSIQVGPGVGVDHIFSVWHRRVLKAGTVTLGATEYPLHIRGASLSMYGVAAMPVPENILQKLKDLTL